MGLVNGGRVWSGSMAVGFGLLALACLPRRPDEGTALVGMGLIVVSTVAVACLVPLAGLVRRNGARPAAYVAFAAAWGPLALAMVMYANEPRGYAAALRNLQAAAAWFMAGAGLVGVAWSLRYAVTSSIPLAVAAFAAGAWAAFTLFQMGHEAGRGALESAAAAALFALLGWTLSARGSGDEPRTA